MNTDLSEVLSSKDHLSLAWKHLRKNKSSHGLSGKTIEEFKANLNDNLDEINKELAATKFIFKPTRAAIMKKGGGKYRPLQIPEIKDRVVLKALAIILEDELAPILSKSKGISFAYQKGLGIKDAIHKMVDHYNNGNTVFLKADIKNFFEEVDKDDLLEKKVLPNLKDKSIDSMIESALSQPLKGIKKLPKKHRNLFKNAGKGIPQGNPLSNLLANVYLSEFDLELKNEGFNLVRYADDFIICCKDEKEANKAYDYCTELLNKKFGLRIHKLEDGDKTKIVKPDESYFTFLSIKFDGTNYYPKGKKIRTLKSKLKAKIWSTNDIATAVDQVEKTLNRWIKIYNFSQIERYFDKIDSYIIYQLKKRFDKKKFYHVKKCKEF